MAEIVKRLGVGLRTESYPAKPRTHYEVLGLTRGSDQDVVEAAYKLLIRKHHPDHSLDGDERAQELNVAYAALRSPERRRAYDEQLRAAERTTAALARPARSETRAVAIHRHRRPGRMWWIVPASAGVGILGIIATPAIIDFMERSPDAPTTVLANRIPPPQDVSIDALRRAAQDMRAVLSSGGVAAVMDMSMACYRRARLPFNWTSLDYCTAFDSSFVSASRPSDLTESERAYFSPSERANRYERAVADANAPKESVSAHAAVLVAAVSSLAEQPKPPIGADVPAPADAGPGQLQNAIEASQER